MTENLDHPNILRLEIRRFRGIRNLTWLPGSRTNVILGGGDVGKSTLLEAIELLLAPTNAASLSDADYFGGRLGDGFEIEAVVYLPAETQVSQQFKMLWPWVWDSSKAEAVLPSETAEEAGDGSVACYRLRASGSPDLDLAYEIIQPDGSTATLPVSLRRNIGLVQLDSQDRDDRDLRLLRGSALDRLLSDPTLRSRLASKLSQTDVGDLLSSEAKNAMKNLDAEFAQEGLPSGLDLGLTGAPGLAVTALMGLTAKRDTCQLPLASWGAGTRRLASLTIARAHQTEHPIVIVDEVERGLEPYRQRSLMRALQKAPSQSFVTTHSSSALAAATEAQVWYVDRDGKIGGLRSKRVVEHRRRDPETYLARLAIVAEGATEFGFVHSLLTRALGTSIEVHGIHITDGRGNDHVLDLLLALSEAGFAFGGFADDEGRKRESWRKLKHNNPLVFQWRTGCLEENIVAAVPQERLRDLVEDPEGQLTGTRLRGLADRIEAPERTFDSICEKAGAGIAQLIIDDATANTPEGSDETTRKAAKGQARNWFKNERGGRELAEKVFELGTWASVRDELLPFINAVLQQVGKPPVDDL